MNEFQDYKREWIEYMNDIRPDLSIQSRKLYAHQLNLIAYSNDIFHFDFNALKFIIRITNKAIKNKTLDFITLSGSDQTKNQRLSAIRSVLDANKNALDEKKYNNLIVLLKTVGEKLRYNISQTAGTNIKTKDEEENMKATWDELNQFAINYDYDLQNKLILNLLLNNYIKLDDIKYYVLLRVTEYATLHIWTHKKKPPSNKINYIWLHQNQLYIQHSKTTGGIRHVGNTTVEQPSNKIYAINEDIKNMVKTFIKKNKIKNDEPLFDLNTAQFSSLLKNLLKQFGNNMNSTMLRKIYENRKLDPSLNANQMYELNKNVDHSMAIAATFYSKKD